MSETKKVIVWGIGNGYDLILNQILFEMYKGNITIEALICRKQDKYCSIKDGFPVITKDELIIDSFDYVIITALSRFNEIKNEAMELGISRKRIIDGSKMRMPFYDFRRYTELIENPCTILSDDCWGGYIYHKLGLPMTTPVINISWDIDEYARFILDPLFYLNTELTMVIEGNLRKGIHPVGQLGDSERNIKLDFVHNIDFAEAKEQWNRRKKRINPDNIFLKMGFNISDKNKHIYMESFIQSPVKNKILFYLGNEKVDNVFKTEKFFWWNTKDSRVDNFNFNDYMRGHSCSEFDVFKLLTGDKSYSRYQ